MNRTRGLGKAVLAAAVSLATGFLVGCTPDGGPSVPRIDASDPSGITVWTTDTLPDRVAKTKEILKNFADAGGVTGGPRKRPRPPVQPDADLLGGIR